VSPIWSKPSKVLINRKYEVIGTLFPRIGICGLTKPVSLHPPAPTVTQLYAKRMGRGFRALHVPYMPLPQTIARCHEEMRQVLRRSEISTRRAGYFLLFTA